MTNFSRRHQAASGAKAGQYVPCKAEIQCPLPASSHIAGIEFVATKQWLGRDGVRITDADVSEEEVERFRRSDAYEQFLRSSVAQRDAEASAPKERIAEPVAASQLRRGDVIVFPDGDGYTSNKLVTGIRNDDGYNVRVSYVDETDPDGMQLSTSLWHTTPINRFGKWQAPKKAKVAEMDEFFGGTVPAAKVKVETPAPKRTTHEELSEMMDLGRVIQTTPGGAFPALNGLGLSTAPEEIQYVDLDADGGAPEPEAPKGWEYLKGFTGQYGYRGAVMHSSEYMGGGIADHILDNPGFYAVVEIDAWPEDGEEEPEVVGWGVLRYVGESASSSV